MTWDAKITELVRTLNDRTRSGRLRWHLTGDEDTYLATLRSGNILVTSSRTDDDVTISLINDEGDLVDQYATHSPVTVGLEHEQNQILRTLYDMARRNARNVDRVIDGILDELK